MELIYAVQALNNGYCEHESSSCWTTFHTGSSPGDEFLFVLSEMCVP